MNAVLGMLICCSTGRLDTPQQTLIGHATHSAHLLQTIIDDARFLENRVTYPDPAL